MQLSIQFETDCFIKFYLNHLICLITIGNALWNYLFQMFHLETKPSS